MTIPAKLARGKMLTASLNGGEYWCFSFGFVS